jgi:hypothetical protein
VEVSKPINLTQLEDEFRASSVAFGSGLTATQETNAGPVTLLQVDADTGEPGDLLPEAQPVVEAHTALRPKTDAEYAAEFQTAEPARKQQIRDQMNGLEPREQLPMTMDDMWGAPA